MNAIVVENPDHHPAYWVGADVAKKTFDAALLRPGLHYSPTTLREVPVAHFARSDQGVTDFLGWLRTQLGQVAAPVSVRLVMEATGGYSERLADWLRQQCPALGPAIVNPRQTAAFLKSLSLDNQNDRVVARALAFYGTERQPAPAEPLSPARRELRALSRQRDALVKEKVREENRAEECAVTRFLTTLHKRRMAQLKRDIARLEDRMKKIIADTLELKRDAVLLCSMPGVGFVISAVVLAELGDVRRFRRARQVSAFVGLSPRKTQSGTSINTPAALSKHGNPRLRQVLYLAAMVAIRGHGPLRDFYDRLTARGMCGKAALCAVMRKMLTIMRALLIHNASYDPLWKTRGIDQTQPVENSPANA